MRFLTISQILLEVIKSLNRPSLGAMLHLEMNGTVIHSIPLITRPLGPAKTHLLSVPPPIRSNLLSENQFCHQILPPLKQYRALSGRVISGIECIISTTSYQVKFIIRKSILSSDSTTS